MAYNFYILRLKKTEKIVNVNIEETNVLNTREESRNSKD